MSCDTVVTLPDTVVMFVAGKAGEPIAAQAPEAFKALEVRLPSLKGRKFYGVEGRHRSAPEPGGARSHGFSGPHAHSSANPRVAGVKDSQARRAIGLTIGPMDGGSDG